METEELFCYICEKPVKEKDEICSYCGSDLLEYETGSPSEVKYKNLMRIKEGIKIFLSFLGVVLMISILYSIYSRDMQAITYTFIGIINIGIFLICVELIGLFLDIEQNTRVQIKLLNKFLNKTDSLSSKENV